MEYVQKIADFIAYIVQYITSLVKFFKGEEETTTADSKKEG